VRHLFYACLTAATVLLAACSCLPPQVESAEAERDVIFMLTACAIVASEWQEPVAHRRGHNIGSIVVGSDWHILHHGLNSNRRFNDGTQHAETRAIRSAIELRNRLLSSPPYQELLADAVVYTTLEPCSMCAGTMDLTNVRRVVYLQRDPSQKAIARLLYELHGEDAALPSQSKLGYAERLDDKFQAYEGSITDFLLSSEAAQVYRDAWSLFLSYQVVHPENRDVLEGARAYVSNITNE
jgi:tRNA(Arg) A34 adenosine deaminase TadA